MDLLKERLLHNKKIVQRHKFDVVLQKITKKFYFDKLSEQEERCLGLIIQGCSTGEMCEKMKVSSASIVAYKKNIYGKLKEEYKEKWMGKNTTKRGVAQGYEKKSKLLSLLFLDSHGLIG